jgi:hypothetical protein
MWLVWLVLHGFNPRNPCTPNFELETGNWKLPNFLPLPPARWTGHPTWQPAIAIRGSSSLTRLRAG